MSPFIAAADWGTTSFRLWLLAEDGTVIAERRSTEGLMAARAAGGFEAVLEAHLAALGAPAALPALLCGMVGARSGWVEAPYLDTPTALSGLGAHAVRVPGTRRPVAILPGVAQRDPQHPDVMRGEETKLCGLSLADALVVMPGTHSKWARLEGGRLTGFSTFMTGELFALLSMAERSVLREAVEATATVEADDPAFLAGIKAGLEAPASLANDLFALRAGWLLGRASPTANAARLSGLLLGFECAGALRRFGAGAAVTLVSGGEAAARHAAALRLAGFAAPRLADADEAVRAGLSTAGRVAFADRRAA